ncbi:hypothetical protein BCU68_06065 [Vibrio sp. 10N.286.49.B3]|uniref:TadE/TadG family type IV pilus assembly protein n=1 Tax=Vibrio sp. 10N.286.49.B3 TaxID=1880855 RepID=UPI000C8577FF|nr:TadE/TadG family type IV pilus assembly protein [Vibrio sp. 10N.286.49.B3]PMH41242.1 hypothetical protein BCU68_06065 [Vibrio sp. 10N.286.49.B3]
MRRINARYQVRRQKGLVLIMVTMAMLTFIAIAAFAIDVNHLVVNKTRLQNAVDSAALAGASIANTLKTKNETEDSVIEAYKTIMTSSGNDEIALADEQSGLHSLSIQYADSPTATFSSTFPLSSERIYVRVQVLGLEITSFFLQVFNLDKNVSASTVAGPAFIDETSNVLPIGMCEGDEAGPAGYTSGTVYEIKSGSQSDDGGLGSGNFHLLDVGNGKSDVSDALVGRNSTVFTIGDKISTEPGNAVGPTGSIDSRFTGETLDGVYYAPDLIIVEPETEITLDNLADYNQSTDADKLTYQTYKTETVSCLADEECRTDGGSAWRRVLPVPILDCDSSNTTAKGNGGKTEFTVTSIGCFFLIQRYAYEGTSTASSADETNDNNGNSGKKESSSKGQQSIFGEFIDHCHVVEGGLSENDTDTGVTRIVLFKDANSVGGGS